MKSPFHNHKGTPREQPLIHNPNERTWDLFTPTCCYNLSFFHHGQSLHFLAPAANVSHRPSFEQCFSKQRESLALYLELLPAEHV